ncbi:hypothetical protein CPB86DRAFT_869303 [Serendipita vermifera]|nr:hypothetical protein CPB86DRAFT_869303 [Serendipita vermifera]
MSWNALPVELLEIILSQVYQPDLPSLRFVSRATNHAIRPLFWKHKVLCVEWSELGYLDKVMDSTTLSYPLSHLVTGLTVRMVPSRMVATTRMSFADEIVEATGQYNMLNALLTRTSDDRKTRHLEEQAEWSIMDAGLDVFYRVVRKFVNLQTLSAPSLDTLFPSQSLLFLETSMITRSSVYPFRNVEELRLNSVHLNRREGKVTPVDLIRCLLDFPHLKTLIAHIQTDNGSVYPLMHPPAEVNSALRHLELTVARTNGQLMDSLVQFLRLTKDLETFALADRTTRKTMRGFNNSFIFQRGDSAPELDISGIVGALSGSHKTLIRLEIIQYQPFSPEPREPVSISFQQFTSLKTLVIPIKPVLPTGPNDVQPHTRCFPNSLIVLTFLRGTRLSLRELMVILYLLQDSLREIEAYVMGNLAQLEDDILMHRSLGRHSMTLGDHFQEGQWVCIQIAKPVSLKDKGQ